MEDNNNQEIIVKDKNNIRSGLIKTLPLVLFFIALIVYWFMFPPLGNKNTIIHISSGESVNTISLRLKENKAIKNEFALRFFVKIFRSGKGIISGDYQIDKGSPVWRVAWQISRGNHNIDPIRVTIREGLTNEDIASLLAIKLAGFRKDIFLSEVTNKQGYLFPDTYFFFPLDTSNEIIKKMSDNFNERVSNLEIKNNNNNLSDIIIMASLIEGEANGKDDAGIISGILWKRINIGMPLQVDVYKDTYKEKGLPDNPINNPGLISIKAAANPVDSSYLYYLHDKNGRVYFAKNFEEHKINIQKYLK